MLLGLKTFFDFMSVNTVKCDCGDIFCTMCTKLATQLFRCLTGCLELTKYFTKNGRDTGKLGKVTHVLLLVHVRTILLI